MPRNAELGRGIAVWLAASALAAGCGSVDVSALQALRVELPCTGAHTADGCTAGTAARSTTTLDLAAGTTYDVTLRIRGVVEQITYSGGTTDGAVSRGGTPDPVGYNTYSLQVSAPAQTYYLNAGQSGIRHCFAIDYTVTVPMQGGAMVTLVGDPRDGSQIINIDTTGTPLVVPDIAPAPAAFDGQFVQMDVVSIAAR